MIVGVIGAMDQEVEIIISNLKHYRSETVANIEDIDVMICKSGIGKVATSLAATLLLQILLIMMLLYSNIRVVSYLAALFF